MPYLIIILSGIVASGIQSFTGFGASTILMLILPYYYPVSVASGINQAMCIVMTGVMTWRYRKRISMKIVLMPLLIYLCMSLIAVHYSKGLDLRILTIVFGFFLIALSVYFMAFSKKTRSGSSTLAGVICSGVSGLCAGFFGVGGPTMALYLVEATKDNDEYKANLQFLFVVTNIINTISRASNGLLTKSMIPLIVIGACSMIVGQEIGVRLGRNVKPNMLRKAIYMLVGVNGVVVVLQQMLKF